MEKQVAETATGPNSSTEIAGLVRGCVKTVVSGTAGTTQGQQSKDDDPIYTKVGYILGLRVSPSHRYVVVLLRANPTTNVLTRI
jgi:hypothetical protein